MGFGMMGALAGAGKGLTDESAYLAKQDDANADVVRKKDLQGWLMQQQQQYQIATEQRTDARAEATKDRDFTRLQSEAPTRAGITAAGKVATDKAELDFATTNRDALAGNTQSMTNAKKTPEERAEAAAKADSYTANAEYTRGAKADAAGHKLDPADAAELKSIQDQIGEKGKLIDKQKAEPGGWDPAKNPGQAQLQTEAAGLQLRQRALLQKARGGQGGGGGADPLNLRGSSDATEPKAQPGMIGHFTGLPEEAAAGIAAMKPGQDRTNAQAAFEDQMRRSGGKLPPTGTVTATPAAAAAAPVKPAPPVVGAAAVQGMGPPSAQQQLDDLINPGMEGRRAGEDREMNDLKRAAYTPDVQEYVGAVKKLRERIKLQQSSNYRDTSMQRDLQRGRDFAGVH